MSTGTLFVVATPIGNLKDITLRALETLANVDAIVCEDTRHTRKLLAHHGITTRLESHFAGNEARRIPALLGALKEGRSLALVTDAGTPAISDPGYLLVKACHEHGISVVPIPGPTALAAALSASGLPCTHVKFLGFPPRRASERKTLLRSLSAEPATLVFYEAPHRVRAFLSQARECLPNRACVVARELTKAFETFYRDPAPEELPERGEFVLLFAPPENPAAEPVGAAETRARVAAAVESGADEKEALKRVARELGVSKRDVYAAVKGKARGASDG
jgi:16S rRNA (cytidine1402-2'-O)-methyltransferase